jgi:biopolymer transport protein ExbD
LFKRPQKQVPGLNMTSTADISFMLLIFFLLASSMRSDKGLPVQLPPPDDAQTEQELQVKERNVLQIVIDDQDRMTCNGSDITLAELKERVAGFVENADNDAALPEKSRREVNLLGLVEVSDRHVISIQVDRRTSYDAYFQMRNTIASAYLQIRDRLALQRFGRPLRLCSAEEREAVGMVYPQRISESVPAGDDDAGKGGGA